MSTQYRLKSGTTKFDGREGHGRLHIPKPACTTRNGDVAGVVGARPRFYPDYRDDLNTDYPFPQVNSVPKLACGVNAIEAGADTDEAIAIALGVTDRQGAYYATALGYLGLAQETGGNPRTWGLTPAGAHFLNASAGERVQTLHGLYLQASAQQMVGSEGLELSDATMERREEALASCLKFLGSAEASAGVVLEQDATRGRAEAGAAHARGQRQRARESVLPPRQGAVCGICFTVKPLSGVCENCD